MRKSLKTYNIRKATSEEMIKYGLEINNNAIKNYRVKAEATTKEAFTKRIKDAEESGEYDFWMAFKKDDEIPVAWAINHKQQDCVDYQTMKADPAYLGNTYPFYGLLYEMNRYYLEDKRYKYVNDGWRSITEHSNIQPFLIEKFNFRKAYCRLRITYKWHIGLAVKVLYPFRNVIKHPKVKALLLQEAMARGEY